MTDSSLPDWPLEDELSAAPFLDYWSNVYRIEPAIAYGLVSQESRFDPGAYRAEPAINDASYGLTQVLWGTAKGLGYTGDESGLYDRATNVQLGLNYLRQQLDRWGTVNLALSAYNGGLHAGVITNPEYLAAVLDRADYFRTQWAAQGVANPATDLSITGDGASSLGANLLLLGVLALLAKQLLH